jgi:hypothetical protein
MTWVWVVNISVQSAANEFLIDEVFPVRKSAVPSVERKCCVKVLIITN